MGAQDYTGSLGKRKGAVLVSSLAGVFVENLVNSLSLRLKTKAIPVSQGEVKRGLSVRTHQIDVTIWGPPPNTHTAQTGAGQGDGGQRATSASPALGLTWSGCWLPSNTPSMLPSPCITHPFLFPISLLMLIIKCIYWNHWIFLMFG
jgi:hypothetical protein